MSDNKDLGDFFNQHKKKKTKKTTKKTSKDSGSGSANPLNEESKEEELQRQQKHSQQQDFAESSDEEKTEIKLDDAVAIGVKDRKEVDADKRKEEEKNNENKGWGAIGSAVNKSGGNQADKEDMLKAPAAGARAAGGGPLKFGKPMFAKSNNPINKMDFPEIGAPASKGKQFTATSDEPAGSGKDSRSIGNFGAGAVGARTDEPNSFTPFTPAVERKAPSMPIFRGKAKLGTGAVKVEETAIPSKQNYDFSSMKMSTATAKSTRPAEGAEGAEGERKEGGF